MHGSADESDCGGSRRRVSADARAQRERGWSRGIAAVGSGVSLLVYCCAYFWGRGGGGGEGAATALESTMRWDPASVVVKSPGLSVHEARQMHSLAQQRKWASLFSSDPSPLQHREPPALAAVSASGQARLARMSMLSRNGWQSEEGDWVDRSTADYPADMPSRQVYEYVPGADGRRVSDGEGAKAWHDLQRHYFMSKPSMSTYPAVPVVFGEDVSGGHPVANSPLDQGGGAQASSEKQTGGVVSLLEEHTRTPVVQDVPADAGISSAMFPSSGIVEADRVPSGGGGAVADGRAKVVEGGREDKRVVEGGREARVLSDVHALAEKSLARMGTNKRHAAAGANGAVEARSGEGHEVHVPKAVVAAAQKMVKDKVVKELARRDEASLEADTDFIMGQGKDAAHSSAHAGGFAALKQMEKRVITGLEKGGYISGHGARKREAGVRLAQKAAQAAGRHAAELTAELESAAQPQNPQQLAQQKHAEAVRNRALKLLNAFNNAGL